jgi:hypothetical protein
VGGGERKSILGFCVAIVVYAILVVCSFVLGFKIDFPFLFAFSFFSQSEGSTSDYQSINTLVTCMHASGFAVMK